ncbi:SDR family oxidoreductase [Streptomyces sp. NPDC056352]|uniref:SDR family oxidoreductase n=1 Tax=Streptomyces sp. NPDC056352 TaxID=3345791 RepID=UPI0035DB4F1E
MTAYSGTKAALEMLVRSAAREFAPPGIRVNVIDPPGIIKAGLTRHHFETESCYACRVAEQSPSPFSRDEDFPPDVGPPME